MPLDFETSPTKEGKEMKILDIEIKSTGIPQT